MVTLVRDSAEVVDSRLGRCRRCQLEPGAGNCAPQSTRRKAAGKLSNDRATSIYDDRERNPHHAGAALQVPLQLVGDFTHRGSGCASSAQNRLAAWTVCRGKDNYSGGETQPGDVDRRMM